MALPVNKPTLDSKIATDLANNSTQAITAQVLRNTLNPIVNSTFGLKTIWSGLLRFSDESGAGNKNRFSVWEDYYDPNYLPSLNPTTLTEPLINYQQDGNRYKLVNVGAGMIPNTYTNISTTLVANSATTNLTWRPPSGLTFDAVVGAGGTVTAIKVNNPGTGYSWCGNNAGVAIINQRVELNISATTKAIIEIDLSRVLSAYNITGGDEGYPTIPVNGTSTKAFICNFHMLNAGSSIGYGPNILINENISQLPVILSGGFYPLENDGLAFQYDSSFPYKLYQAAGRTLPGYYAAVPIFDSGIDYANYSKWIEVKVPIINTTI
jgi:hypothetical protein